MPNRTRYAQAGGPTRVRGVSRGTPDLPPLAAAWWRKPPDAALSLKRRASLLGSLERIGRATPDLEGCGDILDEVASAVSAEQGVLIRPNPLTSELEFVIHNQPADRARDYAEHYAALDPSGIRTWLSDAAPEVPAGAACVADLHDVVDYGWLHGTEFYTDFFRPIDVEHALVAVCASMPGSRAVICLHRSKNRRPFAAEDLAAMGLLAPFVGNHMQRMIATAVLSALPESADGGVILCDDRGRILYCNESARLLCETGTPNDAVSPLARDAYRAPAFVGQALVNPERLAAGCDATSVARHVPLAADKTGLLITLASPGQAQRCAAILHDRFGLSDRELEVLDAMMGGATNREIAASLFVAECTVKKHMQSLSAKVGARTRTGIAHAVRLALGQSG